MRTNPRGKQAWPAVTNAPQGFAARLKEGTGADKEASGATRIAGTANFKPAYAPPNFPRVRIDADQPGLRVTTYADPRRDGSGRAEGPAGPGGNPKRTSADFIWCKIALSWGHGIEATAERLMEESAKAR